MLQTVTVPAFAAENATENVEVATNDASTEEESTFNLIKADVQIDDEYGNETDYISEVQIPDLEQISEETLVENGVSIHSDYPGDAMVYLTQRWLNQEYGNVPGFGYVTEDGRTGWDTVYGLTRALQVELGITDLADNFGPTTERLYSQNLLRRQDGVTNRKFAILQGALWCKGYNPGYNLSETEDGTVVFNGVFDPAGQKDAFDSDNEAILTVGFADISIDNIQESRAETGRTLMVTVKNKGYTPVNSATLKFFKATDKMTLISTEHIASLNPGVEEVFTFNIGMDEFYNDVSGEASSYYFLIETEELESDCGNNSEFVYLYPDYDITLIAGTGGNVSGGGTYVKGDDAILIATPSSGYIFDGWYENGERLYGVSNECKITVDSNRTLEARFKKNDLQITDVEIFGTLAAGETISFTVSATGGVQPWQWEFYIQSDNEVVYSDNAAIVNFMEWTPSQSGTYDFLAFVTDATGKRMSYRTQFVVS